MSSFIWVQIDTKDKNRFFQKCFSLSITIYETREHFQIKIKESDYPKLKKIWFIKVKMVDRCGLSKIKEKVNKNHIFLSSIFIGILLLFLLSHVMINVEVIHSNKEIRDLLTYALADRGIKKNSFRKNYQELKRIKESILNEYRNQLEWIEIEVKGMNYVVRVEERKLNQDTPTKKYCHIVAKKDGTIKKLIYSKGVSLVHLNDYVKKGSILISGDIKNNEEIKQTVCASGEVYADVWYEVHVSIPLDYETKIRTGKVRNNIRFKKGLNSNFIFKSRLSHYEEEDHFLFKIFGVEFYFVKQYEVSTKKSSYSEEEALNKGLDEVNTHMKELLNEKESYTVKNVLKKEINHSTMDIDVFVVANEQIGKEQELLKE